MRKVRRWKLSLFLLFLTFTVGVVCKEEKIEHISSDGTSCGVGTGNLWFVVEQEPPYYYDCNYSGGFEVELEPLIDSTYGGFNRLYFEVKKGGKIYRSNYVEFYSNQEGTQQLEWGGSLPSGTYTAYAHLRNIQLYSTCKDSIYKNYDVNLDQVTITQFTNPQKVMKIEYFCQCWDTCIIGRYDVFLSPNTAEYLDIAFNIANTRDSVVTYSTDLPPMLIRDTITAVEDYIYTFKVLGEEMFLCGVKGFKDGNGNFLVNILGFTPERVPFNFTPNCSTGSLVAVKACIKVVAGQYKIDYNDFVTATTIHELGWQRAISFYDSHDSEFCIMNIGLVVIDERNRYSNPHFCNSCITKIKNVNW